MKISWEQVYTSVACNRTPEIVDWNSDGIICYGACNAVIIYDPKIRNKDPITVLSHHKSRVNSVKWLHRPDGTCDELVSVSADKTAAVWSREDGVWKVTSTLTGHTDGVGCVHGLYVGDDLVVYTGSIDSSVKVWTRKLGTFACTQTINLHSGLCLTLHAHIPRSVGKPVLFCALDDHKIHVFSGEEYHKVHSLAGHEDWVRGLDVLEIDDSTFLLASASQDTYIRIWRIERHIPEDSSAIRVEEKLFSAHGVDWSVKLDAVLAGHEGWVYGVQWQAHHGKDKNSPTYRLLSSSMDKTMIVWEPEDGAGAWHERVRVGEVGGNTLGFYGGRFAPGGGAFLGHGYNGSFHMWKLDKGERWEPQVVAGGHYAGAHDVAWEARRGRYLLSAAADQTARVHAPCRTTHGVEWHELGRPQVHGYDLSSLASLSTGTYASVAEEKVIRVFTAPHNFATNFHNIVGEPFLDNEQEAEGKGPEGASVPSLGLSNKAVFTEDENGVNNEDNDGHFVPVHLTEPPTEETLLQNTLWWERAALYGHGDTARALAAARGTARLASAGSATSTQHAAPIIWDTSTWQQVQKLPSHNLTVTQLAFSPDSQHLLSVSRDRRWFLFRRNPETDKYEQVACTDKSNGVHARIIWCCAWAHDNQMFATGSRDGKACVWSKSNVDTNSSLGEYALLGQPLQVATSVTALAFAPVVLPDAAAPDGVTPDVVPVRRLLVAGFESGHIRVYTFDGSWTLIRELDNSMAHHLTVKRLEFQPREEEYEPGQKMLLASCGLDHLVRIYGITVHL